MKLEHTQATLQNTKTVSSQGLDLSKIKELLQDMVSTEDNLDIEISITNDNAKEIIWFNFMYNPQGQFNV